MIRLAAPLAPHTACAAPAGGAPQPPPALVRRRLGEIAQRHGFKGAIYMHIGRGLETQSGPRRLAAVGGFEEAAYLRRGYFAVDLLARRAAGAFLPFVWRLEDMADEPAAAPLSRALLAWGVTGGVMAPVQDYATGPALLNLFRPLTEPLLIDPGALVLDASGLHAELRGHAGLSGAPPPEALAAREVEVLRLAALGRTEAETAEALGLSRRGVQFHLARAMAKLEAPNKTAAVARAVGAGLITL
jgi:DNA-binding CsgD family transcriptional regulator